jgi:hypothetical protein
MSNDAPRLVDPKVSNFIGGALRFSHSIREKYINIAYNSVLFVLLVFGIGLFLIYKFRGKLTPIEQSIKRRKEYEHVLVQLKRLQTEKSTATQSLITGLPLA